MVLGFLRGLGSKIGGVLSKIPSLLGRGVATAGKVAGGVRKVGEVASAVSRGIGDVAPDSPLRKVGAIASQIAGKAGQVAGGIEKGAEIAGAVQKALEPSAPETEASAQQVEGGAMYGYNKVAGMGSAMRGMVKGAMGGVNKVHPMYMR